MDFKEILQLVNADEKKLSELEARLTAVIASLKQRLQWLNSGRLCYAVTHALILTLLNCSLVAKHVVY